MRNHGGPDLAVYAYAREDLDFWAAELDRPLPDGVFGENLTTEGADVNGALIGERWRIGMAVVLEASLPRVPCGTFQAWLALAGWIKRFTLAARPGSYFRVVEEGEIQAGDQIEIVHRPDHDVTVALTFRVCEGVRRSDGHPAELPFLRDPADRLPDGAVRTGWPRAIVRNRLSRRLGQALSRNLIDPISGITRRGGGLERHDALGEILREYRFGAGCQSRAPPSFRQGSDVVEDSA